MRGLLGVIRDETGRLGPLVDVRFPPKATEALPCNEMTRWATSGHWSALFVIFIPSDADCDDRPADWISERKKLEPRGDYIWP
jgi:hypothetical protein